jgi:hypothetical protein
MAFAGLSPWAILVAGLAGWLVGAVWYMALGGPWMRALGKTKEELLGRGGKPSPWPFLLALGANLVMAWVLAGLIGHLGPGQVTVRNGLISAGFVWTGFVLTSLATNHAFAGQRPTLTAIDGGHWLAVLLVQGLVIGSFGVR